MPRSRFIEVIARVTAFGSLAIAVHAAEMADGPTARMREQGLRMTDFFDTMLPGVLQEHKMTLHVTPKFSDLRDNQYMRVPLELRFDANDRFEWLGVREPF